MLVGILKKLVGIMIGPVGILKNACRYFETVGIMNVGILNIGIMNATRNVTSDHSFSLLCQLERLKKLWWYLLI